MRRKKTHASSFTFPPPLSLLSFFTFKNTSCFVDFKTHLPATFYPLFFFPILEKIIVWWTRKYENLDPFWQDFLKPFQENVFNHFHKQNYVLRI